MNAPHEADLSPGRGSAPHKADRPLITSRRGQFWIPGEIVDSEFGTVQRGPLFAEWEAPDDVRFPMPIVFVHGGGGQGTDWLTTPDGRPGWASRLVESGFVVYVVDRPGHGRSPYHYAVMGEMGAPFPYQAANGLFFPNAGEDEQTQWTFGRTPGDDQVDQLVAAMGPLPQDLAASQRMDGERLGRLLDLVGPVVLITHSAGAPAGWLAADARPDLVQGIFAIEPVGPPFSDVPGIGRLDWGLTAAPIGYSPSLASAEEVENADPKTLTVPAFDDLPISVVTGGASAFANFADQVVEFLRTAGAVAERVHLPDHGIEGNGHGLIFEQNSDEIVQLVETQIVQRVVVTSQGEGEPL